MHVLSIIFLSYSTLLFCQAAQAPPLPKGVEAPVKSLKRLVLESHPEVIFEKLHVSDFDYAYALGSYLFLPKNQLHSSHIKSNILIDVAKFETVIYEELLNAPAHAQNPLCSFWTKLGVFVKSRLDTDKLKGELERKKNSEDEYPNFLTLSELHNMVAECAKDQLIVVSIDIAILKWVVLAVRDKSIKSYLFSVEWYPIISIFLCKAMISLMFYPEIKSYVEDELNEFMGCLKGQRKDIFDSYAMGVASLMLPLAEGSAHRQTLLSSISGSAIHERIMEGKPDVHLSDLLVSIKDVSTLKSAREDYGMRTLLGASLGSLGTSIQPDCLTVSSFNFHYSGFLSNGQFKDGGLEVNEKYSCSSILKLGIFFIRKECNIYVGSLLPLSSHILSLLARYAQKKDDLKERELQDLFYAQGALGILMISAPKLWYMGQ